MATKKTKADDDETLSVQLGVRVTPSDAERLDALAASNSHRFSKEKAGYLPTLRRRFSISTQALEASPPPPNAGHGRRVAIGRAR